MADINQLTVLPRPRSAWQAMDAGFKLARGHYITLVLLWLGFSVPVFALCLLVQNVTGFSYSILVWWWFKPFYELPIHFYLSRALFSEQLSLKASWKLALKDFWLLFRTYLTLARISPARSLSFGVVFLEKLTGKRRSGRIQTLKMVKTRHYLLMLVCLHIEYLLTYGLVIFLFLVFSPGSLSEVNLESIIEMDGASNVPTWVWLISFATFVCAGLVAPFYVAGGFLLYINRRMHLEAWDIEHRFRTIAPRALKHPKPIASAMVSAVVIVVLILATSTSENAIAQSRSDNLPSIESVDVTLQKILQHEDFGGVEIRKVPRFKDQEDEEEEASDEFDWEAFRWFSDLITAAAGWVKLLLWAAIGAFVILLLYTIRRFRPSSIRINPLERGARDYEDAQSHPLTQDLPNDIAAAARTLLERGERRQALSVLFRGALRSVMTEHELKIPRGATESDCKAEVASVASTVQTGTFDQLLHIWQQEAYANRPQDSNTIKALIDDWQSAFHSSSAQHKQSTAS